MGEVTQLGRSDAANQIRNANPELLDLSDDEVLSRAAMDHPDRLTVSGQGVIVRPPSSTDEQAGESPLRYLNPERLARIAQQQQDGNIATPDAMKTHGKQQPKITVAPAHDRGRAPRCRPGVVPAHEPGATFRGGKIDLPPAQAGADLPSTSPTNESELEFSDTNLTPQARSIARGGARGVANTASFGGALLEAPAMVDRGWQWLMSKIGVESADGPFVQAQQAAQNSAAEIRGTADTDLQNEVNRYGAQPAVNQVVEGATEMAVDMATKYKAVGKLIELSGGVATPAKVMALVNGVDKADQGALETAKGMLGGYVRGRLAGATEQYGKTVNAIVQGGAAGGEELLKSGDFREAGKQAVLQGGMAASSARGRPKEKQVARLEFEVDPQGNYTLRTKQGETQIGEVRGVKPEDLERHLSSDVAEQVRAVSRVPPLKSSTTPDAPQLPFKDSPIALPAKPATIGQQISGVVNLPRSIETSFDLSAPGRQGIVLVLGNPRLAAKAFGAQLKAFVNPEYARKVQNELTSGEGAQKRLDAGLFLPDWEHTPGQKLTMREEAYMSQYAKEIPGVAGSERAYNVFLNKLRADKFDAIAAANPKATPADLKAVANFINIATGRGNLGKLESLAGPLAQTFFSPRFTVSRIQMLAQPAAAETALARKVATKELGKFFIAGSAMLGAAKLAGADVELDPRSTDFGKIKIGRTRIDIWGGQQQLFRNIAQQITGQVKDEDGEIRDLSGGQRLEYAARFARSKLSPQAGAAVDVGSVLFGDGKHIDKTPVTPASMEKHLLTPLGIGDIVQSVQEDLNDGGSGVKGALLGAPALIGVGVQTYQKRAEDTRHPELQRLKFSEKTPRKAGEKLGDYTKRVMSMNTRFESVLPAVIESDAYRSLPDDASKANALHHVRSSLGYMADLPDEAARHNVLVTLEEDRLNGMVERSELPEASKERLRKLINEQFKYAHYFRNETRKLTSIQRVFSERRAAAGKLVETVIEQR